MRQVKVGVIGCGRIAQEVHIPNYLENSKSRLEAICDVNRDILNDVAMKYKIKYVFSDYQELLNSGLVEAVSVCVPTSLHSKVVSDAAKCGIHVLCEKPLATNMKEADEMLEAVSRGGVKFMVGFNRRFLPNHVKAKEYLEKGKIGRPILARAQMITAGPYENEIEISYRNEAEKRCGCLFDSGSHLADLIIWMLGKPSEVSASISTHLDKVSVDDSAVMSVKFENGALGSICVAWLNLPDYQAMEDSRKIEIIGINGKIESDCLGPSLYFYSTSSLISKLRGKIKITPVKFDPKIPHEALSWSYKKEIDDFLTSIIKNREPSVSGEQAKEALRLILAAYESIRSKSVVTFETG